MTMLTTNDCQRRSTCTLLSIWSLLHRQSHKSKLQRSKILITCNNFFFDFQNSFSIDSHLLNRVIYFLVTRVIPTTNGVQNTCQAWSGNKSTNNIQNKNIYRYRSLTGLLTAIRGFKHLLSSLFASTFASTAIPSTERQWKTETDIAI